MIFATVFTVVLISTKKVITELIAKIFVLSQADMAEQAESSIAALFISAVIITEVNKNVIIRN